MDRSRLAGFGFVLVFVVRIPFAASQDKPTNPTQPIPVLETGGHSGPITALVFPDPDGRTLLSAGLDKVVRVWSVDPNSPRGLGVIRPAIWRGQRGALTCLAVSTEPVADGRRALAISGYPVLGGMGEIKLYRFPARDGFTTGDLIDFLPTRQALNQAQAGANPTSAGHSDTVNALAFSAVSGNLASASYDGTIRVWNPRTREASAVLPVLPGGVVRAGPSVNSLVFSPDGLRVISGDSAGSLTAWDLATSSVAVRNPPRAPGDPVPAEDDKRVINLGCLAISPDGSWLYAGRGDGTVTRYDAATLTESAVIVRNASPEGGATNHGEVTAIAISHDGRRLATGRMLGALTNRGDRPSLECVVDLWNLPDGGHERRIDVLSNRVGAIAFSPNDRNLAFAGGDESLIKIVELANPNQAPIVFQGKGSTIWDVGFRADGRAIGWSRTRQDDNRPNRADDYEDLSLVPGPGRVLSRADLRRALEVWEDWRVEPVNTLTLNVIRGGNAPANFSISLDARVDRRWWAWSFIPPGPNHPGASIAVACEMGVAVFRLSDGRRTRFFAGHSGPVLSLAPSPDDQNLVTGSADQTVRIWRLAGCDAPAPFGIEIAPEPNALGRISSVARGSYAEDLGLVVGDLVIDLGVKGAKRSRIDLAEIDALIPNIEAVEFKLRRDKPIILRSTRRDNPALSVFPATDREWIAWTPRGLYDASPKGDSTYLGWHRNREDVALPTEFFPFNRFENDLRRKQQPLLNMIAAVSTPAPIVEDTPMPNVKIVSNTTPIGLSGLTSPDGEVSLTISSAFPPAKPNQPEGRIKKVSVFADTRLVEERVINPPAAASSIVLQTKLPIGKHRITGVAVTEGDKEGRASLDVEVPEPPAPAPRKLPPRLLVVSLGSQDFGPGIPRILLANRDAQDIGDVFVRQRKDAGYRIDDAPTILKGENSTLGRLDKTLGELEELEQGKHVGSEDVLIVYVETHLVRTSKGVEILARDSDLTGARGLDSRRLTAVLGKLANYGCRVYVMLDVVHEQRPRPERGNMDLEEWVRELIKSNIVVGVASVKGPGLRHDRNRVFPHAIIQSLTDRAPRGRKVALKNYSLKDFGGDLQRIALQVTSKRQFTQVHVPEVVSEASPFLYAP